MNRGKWGEEREERSRAVFLEIDQTDLESEELVNADLVQKAEKVVPRTVYDLLDFQVTRLAATRYKSPQACP